MSKCTVQPLNFCTSRSNVCKRLVVKKVMLRCQENNPNTSMTYVVCESKLHSVVRSSIQLCQGNWVASGHIVVYYAWAAHAFSAGVKCQHCTHPFSLKGKIEQPSECAVTSCTCIGSNGTSHLPYPHRVSCRPVTW